MPGRFLYTELAIWTANTEAVPLVGNRIPNTCALAHYTPNLPI